MSAQVRCGNSVHKSRLYSLADEVHHHASVAQVRLCFARKDDGLYSFEEEALLEQWEDEARAEHEAEMAVERYFENRGWQEALAQREYEDRMGVVQFEDAYRAAMGS